MAETGHEVCPPPETLRAFVLGDLDEPALARVVEHLERCPSCNELVASLDGKADSILLDLRHRLAGSSDRTLGTEEGASWCRPDTADAAVVSPKRLGDYRIIREVGRGGMGVVYEAEQISLLRRVALKVLPAHVAGDGHALERFRREAKAAARLHHTNIVPVFEVGQEGNVAFYAMQFIEGQGLDQVINELARLRGPEPVPFPTPRGPEPVPFPTPRAPHGGGSEGPMSTFPAMAGPRVGTLGRVAESLLNGRLGTEGLKSTGAADPEVTEATGTVRFDPDATLEAEIQTPARPFPASMPRVHGSSSPVLPGGTAVSTVGSSGRRLPYFRSVAEIGRQAAQGLAHAHLRGVVHRDIKPSNLLLDTSGIVWITDFGLAKADDDGLTATGDVIGTLRYMAPERFRGEGDARADVYALGLTLYELLTLRPACNARDRLELVERIKAEEPQRPRSVDARIPRDLETIVLKAIEKDPGARYPSADALGEDLGRFLADEPIQARQVGAAERYWRWARRNPETAGLAGVLAGVLVIATVCSLLAMERFRTQAETQRALAAKEAAVREKADQANTSLRATQEELRRTVYATRTNLALAAWENSDVARLRSLLDVLRPTPDDSDRRGWEWRYLWQLVDEDRLTLRSDGGRFSDVVFSPNGQTLAGLEGNGLIHLWDRRTGQSRRTIGVETQDHHGELTAESGVHALAFSPDGRRLAGPGPDASLVLYDVDTGRLLFRFEGDPRAVLELAWDPDGRTLVGAFAIHVMRVWDSRDGHLIHDKFGYHAGPVASVAFSPDGRTLASASYDRTVKLWSPEDPVHPLAVLKGHADEVLAVAFSPDGREVCSAGRDRTIRIWDAGSGSARDVIWGHTGSVTSLAYLPAGARVVTGSADKTVRIWDTATGQELRDFKGQTGAAAAVAVSPDGRDIAAVGDTALKVWDATSPPRPRTLRSPSLLPYGGGVQCLAFSPDGRRLVSGHDDHALRVWELPSGRALHVLKGHAMVIECVAFSPDGRTIASGSADGEVRLWDAADGRHRLTFTGGEGKIGGLVFAPDGQTVLLASPDSTIQAWDPATGSIRYVLRGHSGALHDLALSPDGRTLASAGSDSTCILWELAVRRPRATLRGHTDDVNTVAFSPDGRTLATASGDTTVRLWDAADGAPRGVLRGHVFRADGLAFSPDGRLASSALDSTIRLWDTDSRQTLLILKGPMERISCIRFSPDGRTLAAASHDRTVRLWEAAPESALTAP